MQKGDVAVLAFLVCFSVFAFLPLWREVEVAGMAVFGWLMALLMVVSPALTLFVFVQRRRGRHK